MYCLLEVSNIRGRGGRWTLDHMFMYLYMYVYDAMYLIYIFIRIYNGIFFLVFIGKEQIFIATLPPLEVFSTNNSVSPPFPLPRALELGLTVPVGDRYNSNQYIKGHVSCCKNKQKKGEVCGSKPRKTPQNNFVASFFSGKYVPYCTAHIEPQSSLDHSSCSKKVIWNKQQFRKTSQILIYTHTIIHM